MCELNRADKNGYAKLDEEKLMSPQLYTENHGRNLGLRKVTLSRQEHKNCLPNAKWSVLKACIPAILCGLSRLCLRMCVYLCIYVCIFVCI